MAVYDRWYRTEKSGRKRTKVPRPECGKGMQWQARWRDASDRQRKQNFATKDEAATFLARLKVSPEIAASRSTVGETYVKWIATKAGKKPATRKGYEAKWRLYVEPEWADKKLALIVQSDVDVWLARLASSHSSTTARQAWTVLHGVITTAIRDGVLSGDPVANVDLPKPPRGSVEPVALDQAARLVEAAGAHALAVETLLATGLRWQEMAGLNVRDVDLERRQLHVVQTAGMDDQGRPILQSTKNGRDRWVPVSQDLADRLAAAGGAPDDPLFRTRTGGRWRYRSWHRQWAAIQDRAGVKATTHTLRHTAVSVAISAGADVKQVQRMVGHGSGMLTVDRYGHLMPNDGMDELARRIADAYKSPV